MLGCEEVHVTCDVTSPMLLFPKVAVAVNCCVPPGLMKAPWGVTASEIIVLAEGKKPEQPPRKTTIATTVMPVAMMRHREALI
jgi:hypothetical protein